VAAAAPKKKGSSIHAGAFFIRPSQISGGQLLAIKQQAGTFFAESAQLGCVWLPKLATT